MGNLLGVVVVEENNNVRIGVGRLGGVWGDRGVGRRVGRVERLKWGRDLYRKQRKYTINIT